MKPVSFFDKYASEYDWLTNAHARVAGHTKEVEALIERFSPKRVLDAGCATGLTASLFASNGIDAVGLDRSRDMLIAAEGKYGSSGLPLQFREGHFESLPKSMDSSFDLIVCLANAIAGVESKGNLKKSVDGFRRVLKPGGYLVLQALNIAALKDRQIMPVKTTEHDGIMYSRFLERLGNTSVLYVIRIDTRISPAQAELFRHETVCFTPDLLVQAILGAGFAGVRKYADLTMSKRFSGKARDIVIVAQRPR
ncbi:hypothetical protein C3F09_01350 [candidate division GN15 bacterium]|uniref:Methyltransferase domain-containing protein n=1 Tax=candidate division GN15 bacterium TaxID=2072418 RepID=A0A855X748_9BACT|nr:MAG: hypothetical protein C3F09_01350 [candidate division GN15 bacterium]